MPLRGGSSGSAEKWSAEQTAKVISGNTSLVYHLSHVRCDYLVTSNNQRRLFLTERKRALWCSLGPCMPRQLGASTLPEARGTENGDEKPVAGMIICDSDGLLSQMWNENRQSWRNVPRQKKSSFVSGAYKMTRILYIFKTENHNNIFMLNVRWRIMVCFWWQKCFFFMQK